MSNGVVRGEPEVKHSLPSIAKNEKDRSCTRAVLTLLQDVDRRNLWRCSNRDGECDKLGSGTSGLE
jgi:hypothetical protein